MEKLLTQILSLAILATSAVSSSTAAGPRYASEESRRVVENMLEAHGGLERWRAAPAISYLAVMHNNFHARDEFAWWVQQEIIDQETRHVYQDWVLDGAQLGYDGEQVWTLNWERANPPTMLVHFFYYFVNLPWLTQDDGVLLGEPRPFAWPGKDRNLIELSMNFEEDPAVGRTARDYFVLYIDPDNWRLFGYQYGIGYRPFLEMVDMPEGQDTFGPLWRVITRFTEVDGLLFPSAFRTMPEPDGRIVGNHVILNIDVSKPFNPERVSRPQGAVIDSE